MTTTIDRGPAMRAAMFEDDEARWGAVLARDARADGAFVFSVRTTGIYCRPSCPARRARRENVSFHASVADAGRAGFRACKRCRPGEGARDERAGTWTDAVERVCRRIEAEADEAPDLEELAAAVNLSPSHLRRVFARVVGVSPKAYAAEVRARRVRDELARGEPVTAAFHRAGFGSSGRFYEASSALLGMKPGAYRAGGAGATIRHAHGRCSLGHVLVAATDVGVCAIFLDDDPDLLLRELAARFPRATLASADAGFADLVARVVAFVERPALGLDLPLDVQGTAFQRRVWERLRQIPCGTTTTYAQLARELGVPAAHRAVGGACARNPVALAIPCHRVVRGDGSLSGYRWGLERKAALLEREKDPIPDPPPPSRQVRPTARR